MNLQPPDSVLLRQVAADVADLAGNLRALAAGVAVGADAAFIHAVYGAFDTREFSSSELLQRGTWADDAGRLLAALTLGMGRRQVGIRLGQLRGVPTGSGLVLVQTSAARDGAVWAVRVWAVQDSQLAAQPAAASRSSSA